MSECESVLSKRQLVELLGDPEVIKAIALAIHNIQICQAQLATPKPASEPVAVSSESGTMQEKGLLATEQPEVVVEAGAGKPSAFPVSASSAEDEGDADRDGDNAEELRSVATEQCPEVEALRQQLQDCQAEREQLQRDYDKLSTPNDYQPIFANQSLTQMASNGTDPNMS